MSITLAKATGLFRKLGVAHTRTGNYRAAATFFDRLGPDLSPRARLEKAFNLAMMGELTAAEGALPDPDQLTEGPLVARWHAIRAVAAFYRGDPETCLREGEAAYRGSGEVVGLRYLIGSILVRYYLTSRPTLGAALDRLAEQAVHWADRLGEHMPAVVARALRGQMRFLRGDWAAAAADFEWAEHRAPAAESNWAYGFLSIYAPPLWIATGRLDRARFLLECGLSELGESSLAPDFTIIPVRLPIAGTSRKRSG